MSNNHSSRSIRCPARNYAQKKIQTALSHASMCTHSKAHTRTLWIIPQHPIAHTPPSFCHRLCITRSPLDPYGLPSAKNSNPARQTHFNFLWKQQTLRFRQWFTFIFSMYRIHVKRQRRSLASLRLQIVCLFLFIDTTSPDMVWQKYNCANFITTEELTDTSQSILHVVGTK